MSVSEDIGHDKLKEIQSKLASRFGNDENFKNMWKSNVIEFEGIYGGCGSNEYAEGDYIEDEHGEMLINECESWISTKDLSDFLYILRESLDIFHIDGLWVDYALVYDSEVIETITEAVVNSEYRSYGSVTVSLFNSKVMDILEELCPNRVFKKYNWSIPRSSGKLKNLLMNEVIGVVLKEMGTFCYPEEGCMSQGFLYIHMEGDSLAYSYYDCHGEGDEVLKITTDKSEVVYNATKKLVKYLSNFKNPVKEIFVMGSQFYGKCVLRKNFDGEYTMTLY